MYISSDEEETLEDILRNRLVESVFDKTPHLFLPREALSQVVTRSSVFIALNISTPNDEDNELVRFILKDAKRIFATTVFVGVRPLRKAMQLFRSNNFGDEKLPLKEPPAGESSAHPFEAMEQTTKRPRRRIWTQANILNFHDHQWKFLAPVFSTAESTYDLGSQTIPFVKRINHIREGSFGSMIPYTVHPDHIRYPAGRESRFDIIAVKRISLDARSQQIRIRQWESEIKAAVAMNALNQDHSVRFVTAFRRLESPRLVEHYLVSEWADGGDLTDLWVTIPRPVLTPLLAQAFVRQLLGIAKALSAAHRLLDGGSYHGSLKPTRIFWFRHGDEFGTLKIGGWGKVPPRLTIVHARAPNKLMSVPNCYFDRRYLAPEMSVVYSEAGSGRCANPEALKSLQANDMWGLGCIVFECMIWLLRGNDCIKAFRRQSDRALERGSPFYQLKSASSHRLAEVQGIVIRYMDDMAEIKAYDKDIKAPGVILDIIRNDLLVMEQHHSHPGDSHRKDFQQPMPSERMNADELVTRLECLSTACGSML